MKKEIEIKQSILDILVVNDKISTRKLCAELELDHDICYSLCKKMFFEEYVEFIDYSNKDSKGAYVGIIGNGKLFYEEGGYRKEYYIHRRKVIYGILLSVITLVLYFSNIVSNIKKCLE